MKRLLVLLAVVLVAGLSVAVLAKDPPPPPKIGITVAKNAVSLYDTLKGEVTDLEVGEKCVVELVDGYDRVLASTEIKRRGFKGTEWTMQLRSFSTIEMFIRAKGAKGGEARALITVTPPAEAWTRVLLVASNPVGKSPADALVQKSLGIQSSVALTPDMARQAATLNLRAMVMDSPLSALSTSVAAEAPVLPLPAVEGAPVKPSPLRPKRNPCLSQADLPIKATENFAANVKSLADLAPAAWVSPTAPSIIAENRQVDFCFDDRTLSDFRQWLKNPYPTAATLARDWNVKASRWEEVMPLNTDEILAREFGKPRMGRLINLSPWVDHRAFMDEQFAGDVGQIMNRTRQAFRGRLVGFRGGEAPAAFGGFDWSLLVPHVDVMECVDPVGKRLVASLNRQRNSPGCPLGAIPPQTDAAGLNRAVWAEVAAGDVGLVFAPGTALLGADGGESDLAKRARPTFEALEGIGLVGFDKDFVPAPSGVYLYYSPASIRVQYLLDAAARGAARVPGERTDGVFTSTWHRNILAWTSMLDDLGIEFEFLSARRVTQRGWSRGVKVIILPKVVAMSKEEATALRQFVEQGGMLVADSSCAVFDEHGVEQPKGPLDTLFGVSRDSNKTAEVAATYQPIVDRPMRPRVEEGRFKNLLTGVDIAALKAVEPKIKPTSAAYSLKTGNLYALLTRPTGAGTVYLNLSVMDYPWDRTDASKSAGLRDVVKRVLAVAQVQRTATPMQAAKEAMPDVTVRNYRYRGNDFYFVLRHPAALTPPAAVTPVAPEEPMEPQPPDTEPPAEPMPPPMVPPMPPPPGPGPAPVPEPAPAPGADAALPNVFFQVAPDPEPSVEVVDTVPAAPGDTLEITVAGHEDLAAKEVVDAEGRVKLKQAGEVPVANLTQAQIERKLVELYVPYFMAPKVKVKIVHALKPAKPVVPKPPVEPVPPPVPPTETPTPTLTPVEPAQPPVETPKVELPKPVLKGDFLVLKLDRPRYVYDVLAQKALGKTDAPLVFMLDGESAVLVAFDYEAKGVDVQMTPPKDTPDPKAPDHRAPEVAFHFKLETTTAGAATSCLHAFRAEFINPKGKPAANYRTVVAAPQGDASGQIAFALSDVPGEWTVRVTEILTGAKGETKFTLK